MSLLKTNRLLIVSLVKGKCTTPSKEMAAKRNRYIADISSELVIASLHPESSLNKLVSLGKDTITI